MHVHQIAILASGSGTNAEAIIRYFQKSTTARVALVLSNKAQAPVLQRAAKWNVPYRAFTKEEFHQESFFLRQLQDKDISHIVLAGFLWLIPAYLVKAYPGKIINIHPALLPKFGGKGMYGKKVHEAVKSAGEKETGITIHVVNEHYDEGTILFQANCEVRDTDTVEDISGKVHQLEHEHFPKVIERWIQGSNF